LTYLLVTVAHKATKQLNWLSTVTNANSDFALSWQKEVKRRKLLLRPRGSSG